MHKRKSNRLRKAYKTYSKNLSVFNFIKNKITRSFSMPFEQATFPVLLQGLTTRIIS